MAFNNYLEDENDKPYFTTNSLAYYYDKMEGFAKAVEGSAKALNLTKEEVEKRLTLYIEQNKNELDQRLAQWDGKLETFDSSVETLLTEWVDDGTLTSVIDSTLIDQKIAPVTAQLREADDKTTELQNWELQNRTRKLSKPLISFVDDDSTTSVLTKWVPLMRTYNIPITVATIVKQTEVGDSRRLSVSDLQYLQNDLGCEIASHTYTHPHLAELTYVEQEAEQKKSKEVLESWGLNVHNHVYPYGSANDTTVEITRKYYRAARQTVLGTNTMPIETYDLRTVGIGLYDYTEPMTGAPDLAYYTSWVDKAINENSWLIFTTHIGNDPHTAEQQQFLEQLIQYIQTKNIECVTMNEGLNRCANIVDTGRYLKNDLTKKHFVVGADGTISSYNHQNIMERPEELYLSTTPPKEFPLGKVLKTRVTSARASGFPMNTAGSLTTNTVTSLLNYGGYITQEYNVINTNDVFRRYSLTEDTWSEWSTSSLMEVTGLNAYSNASTLNTFKLGKTTYTPVNATGAVELPTGTAGLLITYRAPEGLSAAYAFQEFHVAGTNDVYKRGYGSNWLPWELLNTTSVLITNAVTASTSQASSLFPNGKITYCRITSSDFPEGKAGLLTTNKVLSNVSYVFQEYEIGLTHNKYRRYWDSVANAWSAWKQYTLV